MPDEKKKWERLEIYYEDYKSVRINREDLEKIDAISDVVEALECAKSLTANLKNILK